MLAQLVFQNAVLARKACMLAGKVSGVSSRAAYGVGRAHTHSEGMREFYGGDPQRERRVRAASAAEVRAYVTRMPQLRRLILSRHVIALR